MRRNRNVTLWLAGGALIAAALSCNLAVGFDSYVFQPNSTATGGSNSGGGSPGPGGSGADGIPGHL